VTPIAHRLVRESALPPKARSFENDFGIIPLLKDIHCFDVSAIHGMQDILKNAILSKDAGSRQQFSPFPSTWIEVKIKDIRQAWLCTANGDESYDVRNVYYDAGENIVFPAVRVTVPFRGPLTRGTLMVAQHEEKHPLNANDIGTLKAIIVVVDSYISIINSVKIVNRKSHPPHSGLQRTIAARGYRDNGWTEILLSINSPFNPATGETAATTITGEKALHFVRSHIRVYRSGLEIVVKAHTRGNPALGTVQSRYRVAA
jgi:hypothetical protein